MSDDLKPCPFCGPQENEDYRPSLREERCLIHEYQIGTSVFCPCCGVSLHDEYQDDTVTRWNTRADAEALKAADALVGELQSAISCAGPHDYWVSAARQAIAAYRKARGGS